MFQGSVGLFLDSCKWGEVSPTSKGSFDKPTPFTHVCLGAIYFWLHPGRLTAGYPK